MVGTAADFVVILCAFMSFRVSFIADVVRVIPILTRGATSPNTTSQIGFR